MITHTAATTKAFQEMEKELLPHLFRTEYHKITAVLCKHFGFAYLAIAEDIASDTFLIAAETWGQRGLPANPVAWLYRVASNKAKDYLKHERVRQKHAVPVLATDDEWPKIDLSDQHIRDSELQMLFAICQPTISPAAQTGLALRILCGFGIDEIADAFMTNKETINKRLFRAREALRKQQVILELPPPAEIGSRLQTVLTTLYLLFNEGYYPSTQGNTLRKELCLEAMRLALLLADNPQTNVPAVHALLALMCFHASRFDARVDAHGEMIRYEEQDASLWNQELIQKGKYYLNLSSAGQVVTKYHLEATMAYWHTHQADTTEKWENILQLYNKLLQLEYSPMAALNRTYALAKARGKLQAIPEAQKLPLARHHLYHVLLGYLYTGVDQDAAISHLQTALKLAKTRSERSLITRDLDALVN